MKAVYGATSVEYGYELRKLGEIAFRLDNVRESLEAARRSKNILESCYNSRHKDVIDLAETVQLLEKILV